MHRFERRFILFLTFTLLLNITGCAYIRYRAKDQNYLHEKLDKKRMKVAVLPFTLNTPPEVKTVAFDDIDVEVTNAFTKTIWKKNKVKIANRKDVLRTMKDLNIKYKELNPEMDDLPDKPTISKIVKLGKRVDANVVFVGTVRTNRFYYEGGCCVVMPSLAASRRLYYVGAQMMAIDIDKGEILAFDYINNKLPIRTKFFSITGNVSDKALSEGKQKLLQKCGFALAYYAPMPEKREDFGAIALQTGAALLNIFKGTDFNVDTTIKDETWKMYPPDYFMDNFGYTRVDYDIILSNYTDESLLEEWKDVSQKKPALNENERKALMSKHFKKATQLYQQGKYEEAIAEWEKVLDLDPNHKLSKQKIEKAKSNLR